MDSSLDLITVPAGEVTLTDRRTERRWTVPVAGFLLASTPVTRAAYAVAGGDPTGTTLPAAGISWWDAIRFCNLLSSLNGLTPVYRVHAVGPELPPSPAGLVVRNAPLPPDRQVVDPGITWDRDADGYRLPTEAEWEHACRAGSSSPRYGKLDEIAWYRGNSGERAHAVGGRAPNAWGLYDMLGNVWEWCWDLYDAEVYGPYRVLRGGGWFDEKWSCRASVRRRSHPTLNLDDVGFRLARNHPR